MLLCLQKSTFSSLSWAAYAGSAAALAENLFPLIQSWLSTRGSPSTARAATDLAGPSRWALTWGDQGKALGTGLGATWSSICTWWSMIFSLALPAELCPPFPSVLLLLPVNHQFHAQPPSSPLSQHSPEKKTLVWILSGQGRART